MIKEKTIFILGAGVSIPYGLPSGMELVKQVSDYALFIEYPYKELGMDMKLVKKFALDLKDSNVFSIDLFLEKRPEFLEIGKITIAIILLGLEESNAVTDFAQKKNGVFPYVFDRMISGGCDFSNFSKNSISFITFNYDRILEYFLYRSLKSTFGIEDDEMIKKEVDKIPIIHIHGLLGPLPWQEHNGVDFDTINNKIISGKSKLDLIKLSSNNIRIISDNFNDPNEYEKARLLIEYAEHIFFLGFGFHDDNMNKLGFNMIKVFDKGLNKKDGLNLLAQRYTGKKTFKGSSFGLKKAEIARICNKWKVTLPNSNLDALSFLRDYWK